MTVIQKQVAINRAVAEIYAFLADCNNYEQLMPENIANWLSTRDEASFTIQHMAKLALRVDHRVENSEVVLVPSEKAPFDVTLRWLMSQQNDGVTSVQLIIEAELNMMMKMLAIKPLQKLVDYQIERLKSIMDRA